MLLIDTYVAPSVIPEAGLGLYCRSFVPAGTVLWRYADGIDVTRDALPTEPLWRSFVLKYAYRPIGSTSWVLCVDDARFMNHSDTPNTGETADGGTYAPFDIPAGAELTCDYRDFAEDPFGGWSAAKPEPAIP